MTPLCINSEHEQMAFNNKSFFGQRNDFNDLAEPLKYLPRMG